MHIPSMMLDAQRGQPIEVEVIIGEVVRMARSVGVDIPVRKKNNFFSFSCIGPKYVVVLNGCVARRNLICSFTRRSKPNIA